MVSRIYPNPSPGAPGPVRVDTAAATPGYPAVETMGRVIGGLLFLLCTVGVPLAAGPVWGEVIEGHASVRSDGSLWIRNRVVVLFGVYLPPRGRQCRDWTRPVRCAPRGVFALEFKVRGFITCLSRGEDDEGRTHATCYQGRTGLEPGEDLGADLIERGWALALPNAPFEYHALERIAQTRGLGVWGHAADSLSRPRGR